MARPKFSKGGLVTNEERTEIIRLHGRGYGPNKIARATRRSSRTMSLICAEEGLEFDVTMTEDATRRRVAQLADRRAMLAEALQDDTERLREQLWPPAQVFNIGGKDNTYAEHDVAEPSADAKKNLMASAGIAIEKSLKLVPPEREDTEGLAAVDQWLRGMIGGE